MSQHIDDLLDQFIHAWHQNIGRPDLLFQIACRDGYILGEAHDNDHFTFTLSRERTRVYEFELAYIRLRHLLVRLADEVTAIRFPHLIHAYHHCEYTEGEVAEEAKRLNVKWPQARPNLLESKAERYWVQSHLSAKKNAKLKALGFEHASYYGFEEMIEYPIDDRAVPLLVKTNNQNRYPKFFSIERIDSVK